MWLWRTSELARRKRLSTERRLEELETMVTVLCENFPRLVELEARVGELDGKESESAQGATLDGADQIGW